jgi:hypothetical protein
MDIVYPGSAASAGNNPVLTGAPALRRDGWSSQLFLFFLQPFDLPQMIFNMPVEFLHYFAEENVAF